MDIEKLIERLKAKDFERDYDCTPFECGVFGLLDDAATALSTFQAENEKLRAELEKVKRERDAAVTDLKAVGKGECWVCKHFRNGGQKCRNCEDGSNWEWRGQKED